MQKLYYLGLIVQCVVLYGGIDLNFKSSLQSNLPHVKATENPPAERLVLFVADGLRDERLTAFSSKNITPWLMDIKYRRGAYGVSIASVPTESRPGHVAMLAGIYEDPSAIFKGWQDNPVHFDSVINQSAYAFGWGSPDILNIFNKENHRHIHFYTYPREMQDFSNPAVELDKWVLNKVVQMFDEVNKEKCGAFCGSKTIFFLHLLGMDNAGHAYKPHSTKYIENLAYLDGVIRRVEGLFQNFFSDNKTAFIFTADHGMTNWGSHGSGSTDETNVPVLAWGAGVSSGQKGIINQNDLAPFISALIGINIPTNSLGRLPAEYLNVDSKILADMLLANTKQFVTLYCRLEDLKKTIFAFKPFPPLAQPGLLEQRLQYIKELIEQEKYDFAMKESLVLMNTLEEGRKYYLNYHKNFLLGCLIVALNLWVLCLIVSSTSKTDIMLHNLQNEALYIWKPLTVISCLMAAALSFVFVSDLPFTAYLYVSLPFICTSVLLLNYKQIIYAIKAIATVGYFNFLVQLILYGIGEVLLTASFSNRLYLAPLLFTIGIWRLYDNRDYGRIVWCVTCFIFGIFILTLPNIKSNTILHAVVVILWFIVAMVLLSKFSEAKNIESSPFTIQIVIFAICLITGFWVRSTDTVSGFVNLFCWYLLGVIIMLPFFVQTGRLEKLIIWFFAFMSYYTLVAVVYELLIMLLYSFLLLLWFVLETSPSIFSLFQGVDVTGQQLVRRSFFYLTFALLGFFGTGNFAELSSFDPMWVKSFITSFNPFIITALIVIKISIPIMMCTIIMYKINSCTPERTEAIFAIMLAFCEIMLITFLLNIRTEGSWLEIGTSLSQFIVCGVLTLILMIYYQLAKVLMNFSFIK